MSQWNGYQMHYKHENEKLKPVQTGDYTGLNRITPGYTGLKPVDYSYVLFLTFFLCISTFLLHSFITYGYYVVVFTKFS